MKTLEEAQPRRHTGAIRSLVCGVLGVSAVLYLGYQISIALGVDDVGRFETTLAMSVADQLENGPRVLYGPYTATNHLVLIHAPLFYRLAALLASPLLYLGLSPLTAAFVAGRSISLAATVLCLVTVYRLSRLDGASLGAGFMAVCLVAAAPIPGLLAVMVRPDMLAAALETLAIFMVLRFLVNDVPRPFDVVLAYIVFALAFCVKQQSLVPAAVSSVLLSAVWVRQRVGLRFIVGAHLAALGVVVLYLLVEQGITRGMMLQSAFVLPGGPFREINRASWSHVREVFVVIAKKLIGLIALMAACAVNTRSSHGGRRLDLLVSIYLVAAIAALVPLCRYNRGSADNYALHAVILACVLIGRVCGRVLADKSLPSWRSALLLLASLLVLARDVQYIEIGITSRRREHAILSSIFSNSEIAGQPPSRIYFVDRLALNRSHGNLSLAHDEWLYGAFERVGAAGPRSLWLRSALATGSVHYVVMPDETATVPGLAEPLPELGYSVAQRIGDYSIWKRPD
jgi:hypothetical protein